MSSYSLSTLSVDSIFEYIDLNKRLLLTFHHPSIRGIEKRTPLKISKLHVNSWQLKINGEILYKLEQVRKNFTLEKDGKSWDEETGGRTLISKDEVAKIFPNTFGPIFKRMDLNRKLMITNVRSTVPESNAELFFYPERMNSFEAFEELTSILFEGRKVIYVEDLRFIDGGISELPAGLKFRAQFCQAPALGVPAIVEKFGKLLETVKQVLIPTVDKDNNKLLDLPMIQTCERLYLKSDDKFPLVQLIPKLFNHIICFGELRTTPEIVELIGQWSKNRNWKLGDKLIIRIVKRVDVDFISAIARSGSMVKDGFKIRRNQIRMELYREMDNGKELMLFEEYEIENHFRLPAGYPKCERCYVVEYRNAKRPNNFL